MHQVAIQDTCLAALWPTPSACWAGHACGAESAPTIFQCTSARGGECRCVPLGCSALTCTSLPACLNGRPTWLLLASAVHKAPTHQKAAGIETTRTVGGNNAGSHGIDRDQGPQPDLMTASSSENPPRDARRPSRHSCMHHTSPNTQTLSPRWTVRGHDAAHLGSLTCAALPWRPAPARCTRLKGAGDGPRCAPGPCGRPLQHGDSGRRYVDVPVCTPHPHVRRGCNLLMCSPALYSLLHNLRVSSFLAAALTSQRC